MYDQTLVRPPALRPGDTIGIISPSYPAAGLSPHRLERGVAYLESHGFQVKLARHALRVSGYVSGTPEERAADIHELFADPEVCGIIAAIGGDHSCHVLPHLDFDLIRSNPKVFMGMSDVTVLNLVIHAMTGLVTFNGPTACFALGEYPRVFDYTDTWLQLALMYDEPLGQIEPAPAWTDEFLDWETKVDLTRPRHLRECAG